ncbi:MAG: hypothetical protein KJN72_10655, partial [Woeseia sp.]|nr:hypothetical protein [Woeseia sp.]
CTERKFCGLIQSHPGLFPRRPSKQFRRAYRQALFMAHTSRLKQSARTWARVILKALKGGRHE